MVVVKKVHGSLLILKIEGFAPVNEHHLMMLINLSSSSQTNSPWRIAASRWS
jgi:hypothetical protein